ncbi:MAG: terminase family protein [Acidobacteria bacterium]|nr:terminase family protein [Acidobacteriota bacterium]
MPYKPRLWAARMHQQFVRWMVLVLHRRAGKSTAILNHHQRYAMDPARELRRLRHLSPGSTDADLKKLLRGRNYAHIMPTYKQAKMVAWDMLKFYAQPIAGIKKNESELSIVYPTGARVQLFGSDNPDSLRGGAFSGVSFDEHSQQDASIFGTIMSKAIADHLGYAIWAGTIKGKDQLYLTYKAALDNPEWFAVWQDIDVSLATESGPTIDMLRRAMADDLQLIKDGVMTQDEFDQEWYLSTSAAIHGAYYAKELQKAKDDGRITVVPYDPAMPVDTDWDLGIADQMSIWFSQSTRTGQVRLIDYYEASGEGLPHYATVLKDKGYAYGEHWAPHDIAVRDLGTGKSRLATAAEYGIRFKTCPNIGLMDGIAAVRLLLARCWFDEKHADVGLNCLRHYRKRFNKSLNEFMPEPVHDTWSHGSDAIRTLAVRLQPQRDRDRKAERDTQNPFESRGRASQNWMRG